MTDDASTPRDRIDARRQTLSAHPVLRPDQPAMVQMTATLDETVLSIALLTDRLAPCPEVLSSYLPSLTANEKERTDILATTILTDLANVYVPRYLRIRLKTPQMSLTLEDRQPRFNDDALIGRLLQDDA